MTVWWFHIAASSAGFMLGNMLLKRFADTGMLVMLSAAFAVFAGSNLIYARVLKRGLGQGVITASMTQIVLMALLGVLIFGEKLTVHQVIGVVLALISIYLILGNGDVMRVG